MGSSAAWLAVTLQAAVLVMASPAYTEEEAGEEAQDFVVLTSGNRMTGELIQLSRGELTFAIDGAGAVDIDWRNVEGLVSSRTLDVELASGERLSGSVASSAAGRLAVTAGTTGTEIDMEDVIRIMPLSATRAERTSGYFDLGFDFLRANDELDLSVNGEIENRTQNYLTTLSLNSILSRVDDETSQRRNYLQIRSRRLLPSRWFAIGRLHFEEDLALELDSRVLVGGGGGRTLIQSNRTLLALYGGLAYDLEQFREIPGTDRTAEAFVTVEWDWFELGGDTQVTTNATTYFSFDRSRVRVELDTSLHRAIVGSMYWSLSLYESYDSDPPPGLENSDLGLTITIGRSF